MLVLLFSFFERMMKRNKSRKNVVFSTFFSFLFPSFFIQKSIFFDCERFFFAHKWKENEFNSVWTHCKIDTNACNFLATKKSGEFDRSKLNLNATIFFFSFLLLCFSFIFMFFSFLVFFLIQQRCHSSSLFSKKKNQNKKRDHEKWIWPQQKTTKSSCQNHPENYPRYQQPFWKQSLATIFSFLIYHVSF